MQPRPTMRVGRAAPQLVASFALLLSVGLAPVSASRLRRLSASSANARKARGLEDASSKLQNLFASIQVAIADKQALLQKVDTGCHTQTSAAATRVKSQEETRSDLESKRLEQIQIEAGLDATLTHLAENEKDAQKTYDSSVAQRAAELESFSTSSASRQEEAKVLNEVVEHLKTTAASMGDQGSNLDYVIGVMSTMRDTSSSEMDKESAEHETKNAQYLKLIAAAKDSLQHVDTQYYDKNVKRLQAKAEASSAKEEAFVRKKIVDADAECMTAQQQTCGSSSDLMSGGKVLTVASAAQTLQADLEKQVSQAVAAINKLNASDEQLLLAASRHPAVGSIKAQANTTGHTGNGVVLGPGVGGSKPTPPRRANFSLTSLHLRRGIAGQNSTSYANITPATCASERTQVTAEIVAERQFARAAREELTLTTERIDSLDAYLAFIAEAESNLRDASADTQAFWSALNDDLQVERQGSGLGQVLRTADEDAQAVEQDLDAYRQETNDPAAAGVVPLLTAVRTTVSQLMDWQSKLPDLDQEYRSATTAYSTAYSDLSAFRASLQTERDGLFPTKISAGEALQTHEEKEQELMRERDALNRDCVNVESASLLERNQGARRRAMNATRTTALAAAADAPAAAREALGRALDAVVAAA